MIPLVLLHAQVPLKPLASNPIEWFIQLAEDFMEQTGIRCSFVNTGNRPITHNMGIALYQIALEQLKNIQAHSFATKVEIKLHSNGFIALLLKDNGCGMPVAYLKKKKGLNRISLLAECLGGTADVSSEPGNGFTLEVLIPQSFKYHFCQS